MPSYTESWDETKPAGSRDLSLGDDDIRELKRAIRERLATDHYTAADESGNSNIGYHKQATMPESSGNPTTVTNAGILFTKDVSGVTELFYKDSSGNVIQLTTGGSLNSPADSVQAKTGDWMLSSVTTARSGWTNVSATYADKFMRINATPLTTGGADTHTHTGPSHTHTGTTGNSSDLTGGGGTGTNNTQQHTHSFTSAASGTGDTGSANNIPAFVTVIIWQKS